MAWAGLYGYQAQGFQGQYGAAGRGGGGGGGGYNRHGPDRASEYFNNDDRQQPPAAHSSHQQQVQGMQPWAQPPSAHAPYAGFPPGFGFGAYGAYGGWEGYNQAYNQQREKEDRRGSDEHRNENEDKSGQQQTSNQSPEPKHEPKKDDLSKEPTPPEKAPKPPSPTEIPIGLDLPPPVRSVAPEVVRPVSPVPSCPTEMTSPTSRRKQASPQKKLSPPDAPGGATVLITHAGRTVDARLDSSDRDTPPENHDSKPIPEEADLSPTKMKMDIEPVTEQEETMPDTSVDVTPQRRKSKAEMKEYISSKEQLPVSPTKLFKKVEEDLEAMFGNCSPEPVSSNLTEKEEVILDKKEDFSKLDKPKLEEKTSKLDFKKVEDDMEAMFQGLEDKKINEKELAKSPEPEKKKRGRKSKAIKQLDEADEGEKSDLTEPVPAARATSKRKSAQNAQMKMKDDMDDILDQIINRKKPKKLSQSSAQPHSAGSLAQADEPSPETAILKHEAKDLKRLSYSKNEDKLNPEKKEETKSEAGHTYKKQEKSGTKDLNLKVIDNVFDFQDSEEDISLAKVKPKDKKLKKIEMKPKNNKLEVTDTKPLEEKQITKTKPDSQEAKSLQTYPEDDTQQEESKINSSEEKQTPATERRSRRSRGETKVDQAEPQDGDTTELILDTRRTDRHDSIDSLLKEDEIEARRSNQRKWEDIDKDDTDLKKPDEKDVPRAAIKTKSAKSAESIILGGSQEIKRIFDESLKNKEHIVVDTKQKVEPSAQTASISPKLRGRQSKKSKVVEIEHNPEMLKSDNSQDHVVRQSRRSKGTEVAPETPDPFAKTKVSEPTTEAPTRTTRRGRASEAAPETNVEANKQQTPEATPDPVVARPSRRSRASDVQAETSSEPIKETDISSNKVGKLGTTKPTEATPTNETAKKTANEILPPHSPPLPSSVDMTKKLEIKINKLDLQDKALPESTSGSQVDLGCLMSRYPGLLLATTTAKEKEKEAVSSPTEPEGRRSKRNCKSSDISNSNIVDEHGAVDVSIELPSRSRKRKLSVDPPQEAAALPQLPAGIEIVRIAASPPRPAVNGDCSTPKRQRSERAVEEDFEHADPGQFMIQNMEVEEEVEDSILEDTILTDGPDSAEASNHGSTNVSEVFLNFHPTLSNTVLVSGKPLHWKTIQEERA